MPIRTRKKIFAKRGKPGPIGPTGSVGGTGAGGQVTYWGGTTTLTGDSNFLWSGSLKTLQVGDISGATFLTVDGTSLGMDFLCAGDTLLSLNTANCLIGNGSIGPTFNLDILSGTATISTSNGTILSDLAGFGAGIVAVSNTGKVSWLANTVGTVTSIATAGLLSGGTITNTGTITTSMNTNKLVGRGTAGTGVMEEITLGTNLSLTATTLNAVAPVPLGNSVFVSKTGNDSTGTRGRLDLPFLTINAAVTAASAGDTIIIYPGTYVENTALALTGNLNYVFLGTGTYQLNTATHTPMFAEGASAVTCNIFAPNWLFEGRQGSQEIIKLIKASTVNITVSDLLATTVCLHTTHVSAVINCTAKTVISSDIVATTYQESAGGTINITADRVENTAIGAVTIYADAGSGIHHIKKLINSGASGAPLKWEATGVSTANDQVYFECDEIIGTDGWTVWYAGDGNCYVKAKRIEGAGTCTIVGGGASNFNVEVLEVLNTRTSSRHGLLHAENTCQMVVIGARVHKTTIVNGGTDYDIRTSGTGSTLKLVGVVYDPTRVSLGDSGSITRWNGSSWIPIPIILNNTGSGNTIVLSNLDTPTIDFGGFSSCTVSNLTAQGVGKTFTFTGNSQTIQNQLWFNSTQLV